MPKNFYSLHWSLKKFKYFYFLLVKMDANYAEICMVGNLEADFQQVPVNRLFLNFHILL